jgi:hypothetical protein
VIGSENAVDHGARAFRTPKLKRFGTTHCSGREDEVRQAESVVGMEMRQERDPEFSRCQTRDPFLLCRCGGPTNDARVGVEQISMVIHHNRDPERMQGCTLTR